jgi:hypothetical protein
VAELPDEEYYANQNVFGVYISTAYVPVHQCDQPIGFSFFREVRTKHMSNTTLYMHTELVCNSMRHENIESSSGLDLIKAMEANVIKTKSSGVDMRSTRAINTIQFSLDASNEDLAQLYAEKLNYAQIFDGKGKPFRKPQPGCTDVLIPMIKRVIIGDPSFTEKKEYKISERMDLNDLIMCMYIVH